MSTLYSFSDVMIMFVIGALLGLLIGFEIAQRALVQTTDLMGKSLDLTRQENEAYEEIYERGVSYERGRVLRYLETKSNNSFSMVKNSLEQIRVDIALDRHGKEE